MLGVKSDSIYMDAYYQIRNNIGNPSGLLRKMSGIISQRSIPHYVANEIFEELYRKDVIQYIYRILHPVYTYDSINGLISEITGHTHLVSLIAEVEAPESRVGILQDDNSDFRFVYVLRRHEICRVKKMVYF